MTAQRNSVGSTTRACGPRSITHDTRGVMFTHAKLNRTPPSGRSSSYAPTPAEIDRARNQAMIDGRDKDVLRFCAMGKLDDKSNPQALLGCTLSACRIKDADTAKKYAKPLAKAYMDQAIKVCALNQVTL
jgi:hypothetical protein